MTYKNVYLILFASFHVNQIRQCNVWAFKLSVVGHKLFRSSLIRIFSIVVLLFGSNWFGATEQLMLLGVYFENVGVASGIVQK
jgi:hypothetical protein